MCTCARACVYACLSVCVFVCVCVYIHQAYSFTDYRGQDGGGEWPQGKVGRKLGSYLEDPKPHPCFLCWVTCLQWRQPWEPRSLGGREKDQPHPLAQAYLGA